MEERKSPFSLNSNSIIGAVVGVAVLVGIFIVAKFIFGLMYQYAWLLLIPTALIDYKVITGYFKWLGRLLKGNTTVGLAATVISALAYPFVSIFLFGKAMFKRKIKQAQEEVQQKEAGEFVDFEEVADEPKLQLPEIEKQAKGKGGYEKLFDE